MAAVQAMVVLVTAETVAVRVTVGLATAAKAAVQVVAAVRVIPVETNPEVAAKAVPQSHQRNSLLLAQMGIISMPVCIHNLF